MTADRDAVHRPRYDELDHTGRTLFDAIENGPRGRVEGQFPLRADDGSLAGPFGLFLLSPPVGNPLQELGVAIRTSTALSDRERELVTLSCAVATESRFEFDAHLPLALNAGILASDIDALTERRALSDEREQALVDFAFALVERVAPRQEYKMLAAYLTDRAVFEVVVVASYYRTLASLLELLGDGTDGKGANGD